MTPGFVLEPLQKTKNNPQTDSHCEANAKRVKLPQIEPYAGEFERRRPAFQRGDWGSEPPDPGSAHTNKIRNPQVYIAYRLAFHKHLATILIPNRH
jgi:hypothetical protein